MTGIEHSTELKVEREASLGEEAHPVKPFVLRCRVKNHDDVKKATDAEVLAFIRANSQLPEKENRRYWELRRKADDEILSDAELPEYQELVRQLGVMNVKRLEALAILVQRWGKPVREIMAEFGLFVSHFDEPEFAEKST